MSESHVYTSTYFAERERSPTFALELHAIRGALARRGVLGGRVVEVGAGSGALARVCAWDAAMWIASDRDLEFLDRSAIDGSHAYPLVGDARHLPLADRSCDAPFNHSIQANLVRIP